MGPTGLAGQSFTGPTGVFPNPYAGALTITATPSGTSGVSSTSLVAKNPNAGLSNSQASLGFYTDTTNGSNAMLILTAANTSNVAATSNILMQNSSTGLLFQTLSALPIQFWTNTNVVALTLNSAGTCYMPQKLGIGTSAPQKKLEVVNSGSNVEVKFYCSSGDCNLYMESGSFGRSQLKASASGPFAIYANYANSTIYGLNIWLSSSTVGMQWDTSGNTIVPQGLRLAQPPTLTYTTLPTLTASQVGYLYNFQSSSVASATTTMSTINTFTLPIGVYVFNCSVTTSPSPLTGPLQLLLYAGSSYLTSHYISVSPSVNSSGSFSMTYAITTNNTVVAMKSQTSSGTVFIAEALHQATRIA